MCLCVCASRACARRIEGELRRGEATDQSIQSLRVVSFASLPLLALTALLLLLLCFVDARVKLMIL